MFQWFRRSGVWLLPCPFYSLPAQAGKVTAPGKAYENEVLPLTISGQHPAGLASAFIKSKIDLAKKPLI